MCYVHRRFNVGVNISRQPPRVEPPRPLQAELAFFQCHPPTLPRRGSATRNRKLHTHERERYAARRRRRESARCGEPTPGIRAMFDPRGIFDDRATKMRQRGMSSVCSSRLPRGLVSFDKLKERRMRQADRQIHLLMSKRNVRVRNTL